MRGGEEIEVSMGESEEGEKWPGSMGDGESREEFVVGGDVLMRRRSWNGDFWLSLPRSLRHRTLSLMPAILHLSNT